MKTVALLVRKDLRLGRVGIAAWLVVLAAEVAFTFSGLDARPSGTGPWSLGATLLTAAHLTLLFVVLVAAVQADPPRLPTAFWMTRPLDRWHVLAAKVVFAIGVVALPWLLASALILAGHGVAFGDVVRNLALVVQEQALVILVVLALGALNTQLARTAVAIVGLMAFNASVWFVIFLSGLDKLTQAAFEPGRGPAADAMGAVVVVVVAVGALLATYRRWPRRATALVVLGGPLALAVLSLWPWSFEPNRRATLPASVALVAGDSRRSGTALVRRQRSRNWAKWPVAGEALASGVPEDLRAWPTRVESRVTWPGGPTEVIVIEPRPAEPVPGAAASIVVTGLGRVAVQSPPRTAWVAGFDPATVARTKAAVVTAVASVHLALVRERLAARLPLRAGARWAGPSERVVVTTAFVAETATVEIAESRYRRQEVAPEGTGLSLGGADPGPTSYWALFNATSGDLLRVEPSYPEPLSVPAAAAGLEITRLRLGPAWPKGDRWSDPEQRRAWLRQAELVRVDQELVAEGERTLEVKDLPVPGPAR